MTTPKRSRGPISAGTVASIIFHGAIILLVLHLVRPQMSLITPQKKPVVIQLEPPPPPPPPPPKPPELIKPPPPPKEPPPVRTPPPPPEQIVSTTKTAPADVPSAPPTPPQPPAPPPPVATKVGTTVPVAYYNTLQSVIQNAVQYPPASVRAGEEGEAKVRVHFDRSGKILDVEVVTRTGFVKLDNEAKEVFRRIAKFPPIPAGVSAEDAEFIIELPINFTLQ
ncbi:MAG: TonB family protein [Nevskia sp.]|nr:TonB family protein [Nevskia sp.]